ncbi:MAG: cytochrome P450 [Rhizomicrobium sp.]
MTETLTVRRPAAPVPRKNPVSFLRVLWELRQNPIAAFGEGAYRLPLIHLKSRIRDFLLVNEPESIKHVLLDNVGNYIKSDQVQRLTQPALGNGLLNAEGASWRFQRRTAAPMFQMRHVASFGPVMAAATADMLARWDALPDGTMIDAADEMMRLTYDIICRTVFSGDVTMDYGRMSKAILVYLETLGRIDMLGLLGLPRWVPTPDRVRAAPALRYFRREMEGLIERRKALIARDADSAPNDLLTLLLTAHDPEGGTLFSDREVFDNVMTFVFAGHETTANALAWTLYLLSQFPDADAQVAAEVRGVDGARIASGDLPELPFTRAVLEESMRLYPPAPFVSREAVAGDTVGGIAIRPRTSVLISTWILHRHRLLWERPDEFDPARFLPGQRERIHRFAYLPFGAGPRICIGMGFAMQEAMVVLAAITRRYRLELEPGHEVHPLARITLRPEGGLKMRLCRR